MIERSEEERAAAAPLIVTLGGAQRELPILTIRELKSWKARAYAEADIPDDASMGDLMDLAGDRELDLIAAYDVRDVLGGRDALDDLTPEAAHGLFGRIMAVAFPLVDDIRTVMTTAAMGALQARARSGNGRSRTGPVSVSTSSRRSSSTSSGRRVRSG